MPFLLGMASKRATSQGVFVGLLTSMLAILLCASLWRWVTGSGLEPWVAPCGGMAALATGERALPAPLAPTQERGWG